MMWNWLVSALASEATLLLYDGSPFHPGRQRAVRLCRRGAHRRSSAPRPSSSTPCTRPGSSRATRHTLATVRTLGLDRLAAGARELRLRLRQDQARRALSPRSRAAPTSLACFVLGNPIGPVWRGEIQARGARHGGRRLRRRRQAGAGRREGRAGLHAPFPSMPIGFWNDPERREISRRLFRALSQHLGHGDFAEMDRAWRHHHPRPLRRDAQSRRRAHRHGRDLPPGRADPGGARGARHRPGLAQRRARRAVRQAARRA